MAHFNEVDEKSRKQLKDVFPNGYDILKKHISGVDKYRLEDDNKTVEGDVYIRRDAVASYLDDTVLPEAVVKEGYFDDRPDVICYLATDETDYQRVHRREW